MIKVRDVDILSFWPLINKKLKNRIKLYCASKKSELVKKELVKYKSKNLINYSCIGIASGAMNYLRSSNKIKFRGKLLQLGNQKFFVQRINL